ncbi:MAG: L,D-transpeptidase [Deltaproteobacteria bacterium]
MKLSKKHRSSTPSSSLPSIIIEVEKRRLHFRSDTLTKTYPVAVGKPSTPTPIGNWTIVQKAMNPGGPFGARWMRLSVPWGGYGIHGTNNPKSIGRAVSHGCVRMYNKDVIEIYPLTPIGTPVTIVPLLGPDLALPYTHALKFARPAFRTDPRPFRRAAGKVDIAIS